MYFQRKTILVIVLLACSNLSFAGVVDDYLAHYINGSISKMAPMMSKDVYFRDSAMELQGMEDVLEGLTQVFENISNMKFKEERRMTSGSDTLIFGQTQFSYKGHVFGYPGKVFKFDIPIAFALTLKEDEVIRHVDYVDTTLFEEQLSQQAARK